ncbi:ATP-binding protein [Motilibacter deserti]|uniref:AAA family ATPase n=1 Tax=Motilibacter deserti TaxID=2714956 RepID=A0ABX0H0W0_9ACTN|nr:LuxR C-terminal-related transcriptional regulator [Motilibacter deserti]NHC15669.1 AAA family ATPase [Motilibacter deserti]
MELWERAPALDRLDELLAASATSGRVGLVAGEAGLGKSALVAEFARRCGDRARVLWGACDPLVTPRALGPLHDIARQTGGELVAELARGADQDRLFSAFLDELARPLPVPPLVVVEDVHWADGATLDWLAFLGRRIARTTALLLVTYRDDELGADHPLRGVLAALPSTAVRRIPLAPLSAACVTAAAGRAGRDPGLVQRLAGGNPLLVTELLEAGEDVVPGAVADLVLARLRGLPGPARDLAQLVSVLPTRADFALVADAQELVDECIDAGVLVERADGVSYRHELLRAAVEESLSPGRRRALHRRALALLSALPEVDPGRLMHHAALSGDTAAVLRHGPVAAADAARQGAHREAAAHYRAVVDASPALPDAERAELLERYAAEAYLAGLHEDALEGREAALSARERAGEPALVGENLRWVSRLAWWTGHAVRARAAGARAVVVLEELPPSRELAMAYSNRSQLHLLADELDEAVHWGERASELADRLGDVETAVHATVNVNTARLADGDLGARDALLAAHRRAAAAGLAEHAARALVNLAGVVTQELAEFATASPIADSALAYARAHELDPYVLWMLGLRIERGDWSGALADASEALARPGLLGVNAVLPLMVRGRILAARGDPRASDVLDEAAREAARVGDAQWVAPVAEARSEHFLWRGEEERARAEAAHGLQLARSVKEQPFVVGRLAYCLWRAGGTGPVPASAAEPYQRMIRGEWRAAADDWAGRGAVYLQAQALALGDDSAVRQALQILEGLGAEQAVRHVREQVRRRGMAVPRGRRATTAANAAGLTPRQADVLALLADGLSNAEIADRLTLSAKTVDHHVSAVLAKLGVTSRGQAAALARELGVRPPSQR